MVPGVLVNKVDGVTGAVLGGAGKFLDEFKEALPTMPALGFAIKAFRVSMGLPPEILKALQAAYHRKEQLEDSAFKSVEMDVTLGLSPRVSVAFAKPAAESAEPRPSHPL